MPKKKNLLKLFADERRMIAYHPEWRSFTGSVTATILLQQINYLWDTCGQKPFYKFREPCKHEKYKSGDSWTEELDFSIYEFDTAIKKIGQKVSAIRREKNPEIDQHTKPVEYWSDEKHLTWYQIHEKNFMTMLATVYKTLEKQEKTSCGSDCPYLAKTQTGDLEKSKQEIGKNPNRSDWEKPKQEIGENQNRSLDQRDLTKNRSSSEREDAPALALFAENFPDVELNDQKKADICNTVTNLDAWKYTIWWWKFKEYRAERTDNMLDYYQTKAMPKLQDITRAGVAQAEQASDHAPAPKNGNGEDRSDTQKLWNAALQTLAKRINRSSFNTWLRPTSLSAFNDHAVQISVPEEVFVYWLGEYYEKVIADVLAEQLGFRPTISFVVASETQEHEASKQTELWG